MELGGGIPPYPVTVLTGPSLDMVACTTFGAKRVSLRGRSEEERRREGGGGSFRVNIPLTQEVGVKFYE